MATTAELNQSLMVVIGETTTLAIDLSADYPSVPTSIWFHMATHPLGIVLNGFPIASPSSNIAINPTGGATGGIRITITLPHSMTKLMAQSPSVRWSCWDASDANNPKVVAGGPVTLSPPSGYPG